MLNVSNVNTQHREVINLVWRVCRIDGRVTNVEENKKKKFPCPHGVIPKVSYLALILLQLLSLLL